MNSKRSEGETTQTSRNFKFKLPVAENAHYKQEQVPITEMSKSARQTTRRIGHSALKQNNFIADKFPSLESTGKKSGPG